MDVEERLRLGLAERLRLDREAIRLRIEGDLCRRIGPVGSVADLDVSIWARRRDPEDNQSTLELRARLTRGTAVYALERHEVRGLAATLGVVVARSKDVEWRSQNQPVAIGRAGSVKVWTFYSGQDYRVLLGEKDGFEDSVPLDLTQAATLAALLRIAADEAAR